MADLVVRDAATVVCIRECRLGGPDLLRRERLVPAAERGKPRPPLPLPEDWWKMENTVDMIYEKLEEFDFCFRGRGWEVLLGQNECVNWIRTNDLNSLATMRYPGEYKFAGGALDAWESFLEAARAMRGACV